MTTTVSYPTKIMNNGFNVRDEYKHLDLDDLRVIARSDTLPFSTLMLNLTGDLNVTMIVRSSVVMGAESVHIFGRRKIDRRPLVGCQNYIDIQREWGLDDNENLDFDSFQDYCVDHHLNPILIEQGGTDLSEVDWSEEIYTNPCFVFGNEGDGVPESFMNKGLPVISIPQRGVMRSLNVSASAAMVIWDYVRYIENSTGVNNED